MTCRTALCYEVSHCKTKDEGKRNCDPVLRNSKYFDKEMMEDAILACKERGADPKAIRLWHKLNDKTEIYVKTGVGLTEYTEVGAVVGQGTMGGALVSQAVLDEGTKELFVPGDKNEINYGSVPMAPCLFQDDIKHGANDLEKARR